MLEHFHRAADLRLQEEATSDEALATLQASFLRETTDTALARLRELAWKEALRCGLLPVETAMNTSTNIFHEKAWQWIEARRERAA